MKKRGQLVWDQLIPWIIAAGFTVLMVLIYMGYTGKLGAIGEFIQRWTRYG